MLSLIKDLFEMFTHIGIKWCGECGKKKRIYATIDYHVDTEDGPYRREVDLCPKCYGYRHVIHDMWRRLFTKRHPISTYEQFCRNMELGMNEEMAYHDTERTVLTKFGEFWYDYVSPVLGFFRKTYSKVKEAIKSLIPEKKQPVVEFADDDLPF